MLKLGRVPSPPGAVTFKLTKFVDVPGLTKKIPGSFGHEKLIARDAWGMLANDRYGDCVWAGAAHETMLWTKAAGHEMARFTDAGVLSDYAAVTGFDPRQPWTDEGTIMAEAASYRRKTGIIDAAGNRRKILAYLSIDPKDMLQIYAACYLFGGVGLGIMFPQSAMDQFEKGRNWGCVRTTTLLGGHYINMVAKRSKTLYCVTWGRLQGMTECFLQRYCDEAIAYVSEDYLNLQGKTPEGFDREGLLQDLASLKRAP